MAQKVMLKIGDPETGDPKPKYSSAEQKIVDQYTKMGYIVSKDPSGKLVFKKNPSTPPVQPSQPSPVQSPTTAGATPPTPNKRIPLPDFKNPEARMAYAKAFRDKYGPEYLGGYGDIPLRANEKPAWGSDTSKNLAVRYAKALGIDPAIFYASSMVEGQSGLYPHTIKGREKDGLLVNSTGNKDYPVSGLWSFGLDSFPDKVDALVKKGYLPPDFKNNYILGTDNSSLGEGYSTLFKNTDAGVQAKAAMMRDFYDELDSYASKRGLKLTPEQRDFFGLAHFNSGSHGYELLDAYNNAGLLKNSDFVKKMPNIPIQGFIDFYRKKGKGDAEARVSAEKLHKQIYGNVLPRILAAKGLKEEGYFDDFYNQEQAAAPAATQSSDGQKVILKVTK